MEKKEVHLKTVSSSIDRVSPVGIAMTHTEEIARRLKAADPTMVEGPSFPGSWSKLRMVSMSASIISGALDPRAMSVRFAIVGFSTSR